MLAKHSATYCWGEIASSSAEAITLLGTPCFLTPHPRGFRESRRLSRPLCEFEVVCLAPSGTWWFQYRQVNALNRTGRLLRFRCSSLMGSTPRSTSSLPSGTWIGLTTISTSSGAASESTGASFATGSETEPSLNKYVGRWKFASACVGSLAALRDFPRVSPPVETESANGPREQCMKCANAGLFLRLTSSAHGSMQHGQRTENYSPFGPWWSDGPRSGFSSKSPRRAPEWAWFTRSMASERRLLTSAKNTNGHPFLCTSLVTSRRRMSSPSAPFDRPQRCGPSHLVRNRPPKNSPIPPPRLYRMRLSHRANNRLS